MLMLERSNRMGEFSIGIELVVGVPDTKLKLCIRAHDMKGAVQLGVLREELRRFEQSNAVLVQCSYDEVAVSLTFPLVRQEQEHGHGVRCLQVDNVGKGKPASAAPAPKKGGLT